MSVIIRLQNLPWSANALDIRNFFRGLSIPEGGVHIVGGELGDAFIAFSTDEDARQAMMLDCGKIKEIQVKLLLSSRSEMHKVIETARQSVPILTLTAPAPAPTPPAPAPPLPPLPAPALAPFATALGSNTSLSGLGIPGLGNPLEIPQPAVIEPPSRISISPPLIITPSEKEQKEPEKDEDDRGERKRSREKDRRRTKSRSRSRERKDRKRDRRDRDRDRSRSRDRRRRDRSRSRDRKRDRRNRSRSRDRSPSRHSRDRRADSRRSPNNQQEFAPPQRAAMTEPPAPPPPPAINNPMRTFPNVQQNVPQQIQMGNGPNRPGGEEPAHFDPDIATRLQELSKKRNPIVFQGEQNAGNGFGGPPSRFHNGGPRGGGMTRGGRRDGPRGSRFEPERDCCLAIRNAPNYTSYGDVRRFFPFMIDKHGIKMINDQTGRRSGNIYVRFCEPRSKQLSLQRRNNELKGQEVIVEHLDDDVYEAAVDAFLPFRDDNADQPIVIPDPEPVEQATYSVLRLADLPNFVKEYDIIKSFSDYSLLSIMLNDCRNTRTKTAFVQFVKSEDARQAYENRERLVFGRRNATVTPVNAEEYEKEKLNQQNTEQTQEAPQMSPPAQESPHREPSPVAPRDPRQRRAEPQQQQSQPQAFFPNAFIQQQGFPAAFPPAHFGGFPAAGMDPRAAILDPRPGPIESGPADPRAPAWGSPRPNFPNPPPQNGDKLRPNIEDEPLDCVLMKGLPRDATDRTIVDFLADTGAVPARIHLMLDQSGMPSGDCFCEFRSPVEARRAATKHDQDLDGCRITVDLVMRSVVDDALEGPKNAELREVGIINEGPMQQQFFDHPRFNRGGFRGRGGFDRGGFDRGGFDRGGFDRGVFDRGFGTGFERGRGGFDRGRGRGGFDRGRIGFDRGRGFERGRGRGFGRGRGSFDVERREQRMEDPDAGLEDFGAPGCVVTMENVPFRATVEDIMQFFSEFELTQDDVIRRFNERGLPTGDARVAFRTPFDAQRACKTHHLEMILDRRISLNIL